MSEFHYRLTSGDVRAFDPLFAACFGLNDTIFIQQLRYWQDKGMGVEIDGLHYIVNSVTDWVDVSNMPWLSANGMRKVIGRLEEKGFIVSCTPKIGGSFDHRKGYAVLWDKLEQAFTEYLADMNEPEKRSTTKGQTETLPFANTDLPQSSKPTLSEITPKKTTKKGRQRAPRLDLPDIHHLLQSEFPELYTNTAFLAALEEFFIYLTDIGKHRKVASTWRKQFKDVARHGVPAAIQAYNTSIQNGWQGVFIKPQQARQDDAYQEMKAQEAESVKIFFQMAEGIS